MTKKTPKLRFKEFSDDWEQRKLGEVLKYEQPGAYIVDSTDYDDSFETPVLTAGQSFILGYTNETDGIKYASPSNPVIIFDDFTTSSHFVDFPFKVKSSAMKLLTLKDEKDDIYCINSILENVDYIPAAHERHWISIFSEFDVTVPTSNGEQKKIGDFFRKLDNLITLHQRKLEKLRGLKKAYLEKMFPKKGTLYPELRFSGFTDAWEQRKLEDMASFSKGSGYSKSDLIDSGTPLILYGRLYTKYETVITEVDTYAEEKKGSVFSKGGEVIVPASGETAEDISVASVVEKSEVLLGGDLNVITPSEVLESMFLALNITYGKAHKDMSKLAQGKSVVHLHNADLKTIVLQYPSILEQRKICEFFKSLDNLITLHQRMCICVN